MRFLLLFLVVGRGRFAGKFYLFEGQKVGCMAVPKNQVPAVLRELRPDLLYSRRPLFCTITKRPLPIMHFSFFISMAFNYF